MQQVAFFRYLRNTFGVIQRLPTACIVAAASTLQAVTKAFPFPGLDVIRRVGQFAQKTADMRKLKVKIWNKVKPMYCPCFKGVH